MALAFHRNLLPPSSRSKNKPSKKPAGSVWQEDAGSMFLLNIGRLLLVCTASRPRRLGMRIQIASRNLTTILELCFNNYGYHIY
jgi:hypothetical protein